MHGEARTSEGTSPRQVSAVLWVAFLFSAAVLGTTTLIPIAAISVEVRELIRLSDEHAEAVEVLANLRGELSEVRTLLVQLGALDGRAPTRDFVAQSFDEIARTASGLDRFGDSPRERKGFEELRAVISRSASQTERVRAYREAGEPSRALTALPGALAEIARADTVAQRLVKYNAAQVQASAREVRASLWRAASICAALGGIGLIAAFILFRYAREGFAQYSSEVEARAAEMSAFAARAAHELRSPLQSVLLTVGALRSRPDKAEGWARAEAGLKRLRLTIDELLEFAAAGGTPRPNDKCDVAPVVDEIVAELETEAPSGVRVERHVDPSLSVAMNASHLEAVLGNLVTNAAKYGRTDTVGRIEIAAVRCSAGWVEITVADDGPGIPAHAAPHVFEPLYRVSSTPGGYGIGLATTKRLVEAHGGEITIDAAVARGAKFRVRLPAASAIQTS